MPAPVRKVADPFYTSMAWRKVRAAVLRRDDYRCVICRYDVSASGAARVDHIIRRSDGGADLDMDNLRTLCTVHDRQSHREKTSSSTSRIERFGGCDANGLPLDPRHHWRK